LLRIVRRGSGSVVTWRQAQMVLLSAQGMDVAGIAKVALHQRGPGAGCDPQLQRRRVQLAVPQVQRRPGAEVHPGAAPGDQEDRQVALDGTDHTTHKEQASMIRRYIIWRNNHAYDKRLRRIVDRANIG